MNEYYMIEKKLFGLELNLDTLILISLWALKYKVAFWIVLVLFIINAFVTADKIEKRNKQ